MAGQKPHLDYPYYRHLWPEREGSMDLPPFFLLALQVRVLQFLGLARIKLIPIYILTKSICAKFLECVVHPEHCKYTNIGLNKLKLCNISNIISIGVAGLEGFEIIESF